MRDAVYCITHLQRSRLCGRDNKATADATTAEMQRREHARMHKQTHTRLSNSVTHPSKHRDVLVQVANMHVPCLHGVAIYEERVVLVFVSLRPNAEFFGYVCKTKANMSDHKDEGTPGCKAIWLGHRCKGVRLGPGRKCKRWGPRCKGAWLGPGCKCKRLGPRCKGVWLGPGCVYAVGPGCKRVCAGDGQRKSFSEIPGNE